MARATINIGPRVKAAKQTNGDEKSHLLVSKSTVMKKNNKLQE